MSGFLPHAVMRPDHGRSGITQWCGRAHLASQPLPDGRAKEGVPRAYKPGREARKHPWN